MRQIGFQYDGLPNEFLITYDERLLSFLMERAKRLNFTYEEQEELRRLLFSMGRDSNLLTFPVSQRDFADATLGVMDSYTLGELDPMTLNFKMWDDMSGLVPNLPGGRDSNIFDFLNPIKSVFPYTKNVHGVFDVGDFFMGGYGLPLQKLYMYIRNSDRSRLPELIAEMMADANSVSMHLAPHKAELLTFIELYCKSVLGRSWMLGEMDSLTLGYFDPMSLWQLIDQAASALQLTTSASSVELDLEPELKVVEAQLRIEGRPTLHSGTDISAANISKRLSGLHCRRLATLRDLDVHTLGELDDLPLGMHFYGKVPAIVTVDAES